MRRNPKSVRFTCLLVTAIALVAAGASPAQDGCNTYQNSRVAEVSPIGYVCAYTGGWCIECYSGGVGCWRDDNSYGRGPCGPFQQTP